MSNSGKKNTKMIEIPYLLLLLLILLATAVTLIRLRLRKVAEKPAPALNELN